MSLVTVKPSDFYFVVCVVDLPVIMSQTTCCVPGCIYTQQDGSLHRFPNPDTDLERFRTWVLKIGGAIVGLNDHYIFKNRRVCSKHFHPMHVYTKKLSAIAIPQFCLPGVTVRRPQLAPIDMNVGRDIASLAPGNLIVPEMLPSTSQQKIECQGVTVRRPQLAPIDMNFGRDIASLAPGNLIVPEMLPSTSQQKIECQGPAHCKLNKTEGKLRKLVAKFKKTIRKMENTNKNLKNKLAVTKKFMKSQAYENVTKNLNSSAKLFFAMQVRQAQKKPRGRRFTLDEKILALSLYKPSPKAYKLLSEICILPNRRTLDKLLAKINLKCGINDISLDHLEKRVKKMPKSHRHCSIVFDEMAISAHLTYNKTTDLIEGFVDDGTHRSAQFCDHVLVFMIRGLFKKYKQPIAYSFCSGTTKTTNLSYQIKKVIASVQKTGLDVMCTVSDQGATNIAAINALLHETKVKYLKKDKEWRGTYYEINNKKIHHVYDPPHLIKGIRNNLLLKNLHFEMEGKAKVAKWSHFQALLRRGPCYKGVKMVYKLTDQHVEPNRIPKMRVKHATQVFSRSVGVALGFMSDMGKLPDECKDTADLVMLIDEVFDSVNGSHSSCDDGKIYRKPVTPKSLHHQLWNKSIPIFKTMYFMTPNGQKSVVPSINSWIKTLENFQQISKEFEKKGITSLLLRNFNQDPLENFFGAIRVHGQSNIMPNCNQFMSSYKILLTNNIVSKNSVGANCESDNLEYLQSLKYFLTLPPTDKNGPETVYDEHLCITLIDSEKLIKSKGFDDQEKCAAAAYCCGWLINVSKKNLKKCATCKIDLECSQEEDFHKFISLKKYTSSSWLHYPTRALLDLFIQIEHMTQLILEKYPCKENISTYIKLIIEVNLNFSFLKCEEHRQHVKKFLLNKSVTFFINNYIKEINNLLSGKILIEHQNDNLKNTARKYYLKHKTKPTKRAIN